MKRVILLFVSLVVMAFQLLFAQSFTVKGKVIAEEGNEPLIGVAIMQEGTNNGVITDIDGNYSIEIKGVAQATLVYSYIGMQQQQHVVTPQTQKLDITLKSDAQLVDEVVVVAYGVRKKGTVTGSVSTVKSEKIESVPTAGFDQALQGQTPGLMVMSNSGEPSKAATFQLRGTNSINSGTSPLFILDGVPISSNDFNTISPSDIESISVLKDASSTSIYGARAANGVVLITTKRGKEGRTVVSYSGSYSIQQYTDNYDVYNLKEWMNAMNTATWDLWMYENNVYPYGDRTLQEAIDSPKNGVAYKLSFTDKQIAAAGEGTDWLDLITRNGSVQQHNVSVQGGSKNTNFMMSLNYYDNRVLLKIRE